MLSRVEKIVLAAGVFGTGAWLLRALWPESKAVAAARSARELSAEGLAFIAQHEGFRPALYSDAAGHCTIGYGHLVHRGRCDGSEPAELRAGLSEEAARQLLAEDAQIAVAAVRDAVMVPLTQPQFDALVSFAFNVGAGAFRRSTLLDKLNSGDYAAVPTELLRWVYAGGQKLQGLVNRRIDEGRLFARPAP